MDFRPYNDISREECVKFISALYQEQWKVRDKGYWIHLDLIRRMYFHKSHKTFQPIIDCVWRNRYHFGIRIQPVNIVASIIQTKRYYMGDICVCGVRLESISADTDIIKVEPIRSFEEADKTLSR